VAFCLVDGPGGLDAHPVLAEEVALLLGPDDAGASDDRTEFLFKS
jgi:hypothetical protein